MEACVVHSVSLIKKKKSLLTSCVDEQDNFYLSVNYVKVFFFPLNKLNGFFLAY